MRDGGVQICTGGGSTTGYVDLASSGLKSWLLDVAEVPLEEVEVIEAGVTETEATRAAEGARGDRIVVLSGGVGVGKTVAACWELAQPQIKTGLFVRVVRLARWDRYDEDAMARLLDPALLVIDDLGSEFNDAKGNFLTIFDEVMIVRAGDGKRTIITTNLNLAAFRERYGERVLDRVRKYGSFFEFSGQSLRRRA